MGQPALGELDCQEVTDCLGLGAPVGDAQPPTQQEILRGDGGVRLQLVDARNRPDPAAGARPPLPFWMASSRAVSGVGAAWGRGLLTVRGFTWSPGRLGEVPAEHFPEILPALPHLADHGGLEPAVHHAVGAALVPLVLVLLPVGLPHQLVEGLVVAWGGCVLVSLDQYVLL